MAKLTMELLFLIYVRTSLFCQVANSDNLGKFQFQIIFVLSNFRLDLNFWGAIL